MSRDIDRETPEKSGTQDLWTTAHGFSRGGSQNGQTTKERVSGTANPNAVVNAQDRPQADPERASLTDRAEICREREPAMTRGRTCYVSPAERAVYSMMNLRQPSSGIWVLP